MKKISLILLSLLILVGCSSTPDPSEDPIEEPVARKNIEFKVGEEDFTLPTTFQLMKDRGWWLELSDEYKIPPNSYLPQQGIRNEMYYLLVTFYNDTDEEIALKDSKIVEVWAEQRTVFNHYRFDVPPDLTLEPNINWDLTQEQAATLFDVEPKIEENNVFISYVYELETNQRIGIRYRKGEDSPTFIELKDYGEDVQ